MFSRFLILCHGLEIPELPNRLEGNGYRAWQLFAYISECIEKSVDVFDPILNQGARYTSRLSAPQQHRLAAQFDEAQISYISLVGRKQARYVSFFSKHRENGACSVLAAVGSWRRAVAGCHRLP